MLPPLDAVAGTLDHRTKAATRLRWHGWRQPLTRLGPLTPCAVPPPPGAQGRLRGVWAEDVCERPRRSRAQRSRADETTRGPTGAAPRAGLPNPLWPQRPHPSPPPPPPCVTSLGPRPRPKQICVRTPNDGAQQPHAAKPSPGGGTAARPLISAAMRRRPSRPHPTPGTRPPGTRSPPSTQASDPGGRQAMAHNACAQRSRAEDTDRSPLTSTAMRSLPSRPPPTPGCFPLHSSLD
jgi:hypothetical protein